MALRREETAEPWTQLQLLYGACDPAGYDGCRHRGEPFGQPLYVLPHIPWTDFDARGWSRRDRALRLFSTMRPRWRRTLARLVESSGDGDDLDPWQKQADTEQFLNWQTRLPMTRNVPQPMARSALLHVVAGLVDTRPRGPRRMIDSLDEAALHIRQWRFNARLVDGAWLRATYGLSRGEAAVIALLLRGLPRRAIGVHRGVGDEGIKEQLERARRKIRSSAAFVPQRRTLTYEGHNSE